MRRQWLIVMAATALLGAAAAGAGDEVDDLVAKLKPPRRFKDHKARFSVTKRTFRFEHLQGPISWDFYVVKDGDRHVALIPLPGFHSGTIYLLAHDPVTAPRQLRMPTERWHIDTAMGAEIRTDAFIPKKQGATEATYEFAAGDGTLTLARRYKGTAQIRKWTHRANAPQTIDAANTFVLRCHPVFGYMVEGTYETNVTPAPRRFEYASLAVSGRYSLWPGTETCSRSVVTPPGGDGYEGYWLNLAAIGAAKGFRCRDGGFAGFLNDRTGWSWAMTTRGGEARIVVCNAHADLDFVSSWPREATAAGRHVHRHRLLALPPELTRHVWDRMKVRHEGRRKVQIRVGTLETFEDQPLAYTTRVRGLSFTGAGPEITTEHAHGGSRSMVVAGRVWPNLPQLVLKPDARYRVEAWIKVVPWTAAERAAAEEKARARIDRARKKGGKVEDFQPLPPAEAYISADFYEWSPHSGQMVRKMRTTSAGPGGQQWQRVALEFESPKWGPFLNLAFHAQSCTAYVDDLRIAEVGVGGD
jgi:hypothetical protein